jgi:small-conductance mechanosensitive channel
MEIIREFVDAYGISFVMAVLTFAGIGAISLIVSWIIIRLSKGRDIYRAQILVLVGKVVRILGLIIALITGLGTLGINVSALVASLGLTGFALGFALKDAVSNLLAGVLIILYQPFQIGDDIEVMGCKGRVKDINLRYITIEQGKAEHLLPNAACLTQKITKQK